MRKSLTLISLMLGVMLLISVSGVVSAGAFIETYDSNSYTIVKETFNQGETVYAKGIDGLYNDLRLVFKNPSGNPVGDCAIQQGPVATCDLNLASDAPTGVWTVTLQWKGQCQEEWCSGFPEPFTVEDNTPPEITNIQSEDYLSCGEDVAVCADVTDESEIDSVTLFCQSSSGWTASGPMTGSDGTYCGEASSQTLHVADGVTVECTITAEDEFENEATEDVSIITYDCADPNGDFVCSPLTGDEPLTTNCDATFTDASPLTYAWTFAGGNPTSSTDEDPAGIEYVQDGLYAVSLVVTDAVGHTTTIEKTDYIEVLDTNPIADFSYSGDLVEGYEVSFLDQSTSYDGIVSWSWDFGDTETSTEKNPIHIFAGDGTYPVSLTVCEADSDCDTYTEDVEIQPMNELPLEEVAAFYEFGYSIDTELTGLSCSEFGGVTLPDGMSLTSSGSECVLHWVPTNDQRSETGYLVVIKAQGSEGTKYYSLNVAVWSWIIDLEEGWNLISIPLVPENGDKLEDIFGNKGEGIHDSINRPTGSGYSVYQYDGISDEWVYARPTSSSWSSTGTLEHIVPGYGYWINMDNADTLKGMGVKYYEAGQNSGQRPSIDVSTLRWNLIGRYGIVGTTPGIHGSLSKEIALKNVDKADNTIHVYNELGPSVSELENNEGYWMLVEEHFTRDESLEMYTPIELTPSLDYYDWN